MIFAARMLHDKLPDVKEPGIVNFIADTSYGVYLFHWPFYIIFTQLMSNGLAVLLTTLLSLTFAALVFLYLGANSCWSSASYSWEPRWTYRLLPDQSFTV